MKSSDSHNSPSIVSVQVFRDGTLQVLDPAAGIRLGEPFAVTLLLPAPGYCYLVRIQEEPFRFNEWLYLATGISEGSCRVPAGGELPRLQRLSAGEKLCAVISYKEFSAEDRRSLSRGDEEDGAAAASEEDKKKTKDTTPPKTPSSPDRREKTSSGRFPRAPWILGIPVEQPEKERS